MLDGAMHDDDRPLGRLLTRREALSLLGAGGVAAFAAWPRGAVATAASGPCVARPALTEGPYFVDEQLDRSDIRSDPADGSVRPGAPLRLTLRVSRLTGGACRPLPGARVDLWHCDAAGVYSDVTDRGGSTVGRKFLRGYQLTDGEGAARFTTIYPGWYPGRAVHIHFKVRVKGEERGYGFSSQLYFDDALTDRVHARAPYSARAGGRTKNSEDGLFRRGGRQLTLAVTETGDGLAAAFNVALKLA